MAVAVLHAGTDGQTWPVLLCHWRVRVSGPERGDVEVDEDGTRWIVVDAPNVVNGRPSRVREGSLAASVIFELEPEKPTALRTPSLDFA